MRLIDADKAIGRYYAEWEKQDISDGAQDRDWLKQCIDEAPTIDAVPVVRCRECKHYKDLGTYYRLMDCTHRDGLTNPDEDDFCSYGQRKETDHEVSEP
jgi:hypothetical protein|nr:MAG TPA: hypothetical protein [Caudoviricetes sp.]